MVNLAWIRVGFEPIVSYSSPRQAEIFTAGCRFDHNDAAFEEVGGFGKVVIWIYPLYDQTLKRISGVEDDGRRNTYLDRLSKQTSPLLWNAAGAGHDLHPSEEPPYADFSLNSQHER